MPKLIKDEINSLVNFIRDGFLVHDVYFLNTYLTFRSLTKTNRQVIHSKFKYLGTKFNLFLVLDILSKSIYKIAGIELKEEDLRKRLQAMHPNVIMQIYEQYHVAEEKFDSLLEKIEVFAKTNESKNLWQVYRMNFSIENLNEHQYFWVLININKDKSEQYKFDWSKIEYMTNSICAFINPKEYKRLKNQMNISQQFEDDDEEPFEFEEQEQDKKGIIDLGKETMNSMVKKEGENQQDYYARVSSTLVEINKGKIIDEHDQIVRDYELGILRNMLKEKRKQIEVASTLRKRSELIKHEDLNIALSKDGIYHEAPSYIGDEKTEERLVKEMQKEGFFFNGNSYSDIAKDRYFASIPISERERIFEEVMSEQIDLEKEAEIFMKNQSGQSDTVEQPKTDEAIDTIKTEQPIARSDASGPQDIPKDAFKEETYFEESEEEFIKKESAAFKAARMNIDTKSKVRVVKNSANVNAKIVESGKKLDTNDDVDQMIIK